MIRLKYILTERTKILNYKIYLAGPDVFRKDAVEKLNRLKIIAQKYGAVGLAPLDNAITPNKDDTKHMISSKIFFANVDLINQANVIIANIEPFRGPGVDDGTAFEIGYGYAKGLKIYGYSQLSDLSLKDITKKMFDIKKQPIYSEYEDFDNPVNLMIADSIKSSGGKIFKTFEECLIDLNNGEYK